MMSPDALRWNMLIVCTLLVPTAVADHGDLEELEVVSQAGRHLAQPMHADTQDTNESRMEDQPWVLYDWVISTGPFDPKTGLLPPGPTNLRAGKEAGAVRLDWDAAKNDNVTVYNVYRLGLPRDGSGPGEPGGEDPLDFQPWRPLHQVPGAQTTFLDTTVDLDERQYVYVVTAVYGEPRSNDLRNATTAQRSSHENNGNESPPSNPAFTDNAVYSCVPFELNQPSGSGPPEIHPECIHTLNGLNEPGGLHIRVGSG